MNKILIPSGILAALAFIPATALGHSSGADTPRRSGTYLTGPFSIHLPANWTPIEPDAQDLAHRWKQAGITQAQDQATIVQAAHHHGLLAVADDSQAASPAGIVTSFALDCAQGAGKSSSDQLAAWRQLLKSSKASGGSAGVKSLNGYPAAWMSYPVPGGQSLHRLYEYVQGHAMSCYATLTTDQLNRYNPDFDRILQSLRIP